MRGCWENSRQICKPAIQSRKTCLHTQTFLTNICLFSDKKKKSSNNPIHVILDHQKATLKSITIELEKLLLTVQFIISVLPGITEILKDKDYYLDETMITREIKSRNPKP